jgi:uncharacterized membrane protein YgcG
MLDAPAFVVVAFTLASALLLVEVALPTFGVAGVSGLGLAAAGAPADGHGGNGGSSGGGGAGAAGQDHRCRR